MPFLKITQVIKKNCEKWMKKRRILWLNVFKNPQTNLKKKEEKKGLKFFWGIPFFEIKKRKKKEIEKKKLKNGFFLHFNNVQY